ncbi:hypothetical protein [Amycolatopsis taiwanensis]|uniref:hypothetical protein n=1 Tax=Amycolatopsis taiwanensis TaxID=342230 RepID=UPI00047FB762|nr:hypothetical protein [Amycolatopsis taiwanensis]
MTQKDDPGPTVPIAKWATDGKALKADPSSFSGYGKNVATLRGNLESDSLPANTALAGGGQDVALSTGGFPPGTTVQKLAGRNAREMAQCLPDLTNNLAAISSVALIMGDLFKDMDAQNSAMLNAVEWAFVMPGGNKPADLPYYIDPKQTLESLTEKSTAPPPTDTSGDKLLSKFNFGTGEVYTYQTADGGIRSKVITSNGETEMYTDKKGNTVYQIEKSSDGKTVTTTYYQHGKPVRGTRQVTTTDTATDKSSKVTDQKTTVDQLDKDGKVVPKKTTTNHTVTTTYQDGTHTRQYYTEDAHGKKTNERDIGLQGDPVTGKDWSELADQRLAEANRVAGGA